MAYNPKSVLASLFVTVDDPWPPVRISTQVAQCLLFPSSSLRSNAFLHLPRAVSQGLLFSYPWRQHVLHVLKKNKHSTPCGLIASIHCQLLELLSLTDIRPSAGWCIDITFHSALQNHGCLSNAAAFFTSDTSSTAQGGGGSFKNRKPIGEIGCCESEMAERSHCWTARRLISLTLVYLSVCLSVYLSIYLSV